MKFKNYFVATIISILIISIVIIEHKYNSSIKPASYVYKVYLKGEELGTIKEQKELLELINNEQKEIKNKYDVKNVYPPSSLNIVKTNSFYNEFSSVEDMYKKIELEDAFTIKGYKITIKKPEETLVINTLNKNIFENAIDLVVSSFIEEELLSDYLNDKQEEIEETGEIIELAYFEEGITLKKAFIDVNEKIFTNEIDLAQYLLFGEDADITNYVVKQGDTIESISEEYIINTKEFLIANPNYKSDTSMLTVGEKVNVTILNPVLNLVVETKKIEDIENMFMSTTKHDNSKVSSYNEITQAGVSGITRLTQHYKTTNGEQSQEVRISKREVIRETVDQIVTKGSKYMGGISGTYVDTGLDWGWATNVPYIVTSPFGYRWGGSMHNGIDISGTGHGSPIYSVADGIVTQSSGPCTSCGSGTGALGLYVVINHGNNIYTTYMHLSKVHVGVGASVTKGQRIGAMGNTGRVVPAPTASNPTAGTHLHLSVSEGEPFVGGYYKFMDPFKTIYK